MLLANEPGVQSHIAVHIGGLFAYATVPLPGNLGY